MKEIEVLEKKDFRTRFAPGLLLAESREVTEKPLGRDISHWQGDYNPDVSELGGVLWVAIKAAQGERWRDPRFEANWEKAGNTSLDRTAYFYFHPAQSVSKQADLFFRVFPEIEVWPRVIDIETSDGLDPRLVGERLFKFSDLITTRDGIRPIIYSRTLLLNPWLKDWTATEKNLHFYWLAQYLFDRVREDPRDIIAPNGVALNRIIWHQTADKKPPFPGEADSHAIDWNRFLLGDTGQDYYDWVRDNFGGGGPVDPPDHSDGIVDRADQIIDLARQIQGLAL